MKSKYLQYILKCDPFATKDDIESVTEINDWDLLIIFKDGRQILYDTFNNFQKNKFYNSINEITEEQEKREFAYRLRSIMNRKGITQEQLAEIIETSQVMISRYTTGQTIPSVIVLRKIAKALNCSMDDFFYKDI